MPKPIDVFAISILGLTFFFNSTSDLKAAGAMLTNSPLVNGKVVIGWNSRGTLETASQLNGPWTAIVNATNPYTVSTTDAQFFRLNQTVDATTLHKKVLCGYQGWFRCPGDPAGNAWFHWSKKQTQITTNTLDFDMWPEMSEYTHTYPVPGFTNSDGTQAYLYSSQDQQTLDVHFDWMQDYGIDGVVLQRFVTAITTHPEMTNVLNFARAAANRTGRVFTLEYSIKGVDLNVLFSQLTNDWINLVVNQKVTEDPRYLHQDGKPVLLMNGFYSSRYTNSIDNGAELLKQIIYWFKTNSIQNVFLIGSGDWQWRTDTTAGWSNVFRSFDGYCPWNTGNTMAVGTNRYANTSFWAADLAEANRVGMLYMPDIWPGDSRINELNSTNSRPRLGGDFLWKQFYAAANLGIDTAFVGMFDEVNEGTEIYKISNTPPTQAYTSTYEGLPSDWYLRLTAEGSKVLSGERPNTSTIPISP